MANVIFRGVTDMQIQADDTEIIILTTGQSSKWLSEEQQREILIWFWANKPDMVRDIVCENCPEVS
jgi:hypothetical protein